MNPKEILQAIVDARQRQFDRAASMKREFMSEDELDNFLVVLLQAQLELAREK